jgi:hypothetical protein
MFISTLPEVNVSDISGERGVLAKLIDDYNATDNPGKYLLRTGPNGEFTVMGTNVRSETGALEEVVPLLDIPVTLPRESRSLGATVEIILNALSSEIGKKVFQGDVPNNDFRRTQVIMGADKMPARRLLQQALATTGRPLLWDLFYSPDTPRYMLNITVAAAARGDGHGGKILTPIDRHPTEIMK